jgi:NAD-reducing hydrogenase small subunit
MPVQRKLKVATVSLAGCFGCHMSFLDIDERLLGLIEAVDLDRSPLTDIKECSEEVDIGLVEGGICNAENVHTLREFREHCRILVACGACAITGGVPAMRNGIKLKECLEEAYIRGAGVDNPQIPDDPELPLLLDRVHPLHEIVKVDYYLPGCPPPADAFWELLDALRAGREPSLTYAMRRFD